MVIRFAIGIILLLVAGLYLASLLAPDRQAREAALGLGQKRGDPTRGASLYREHCATCHGDDLRGSEQGPPLLHPVYKPDHHADLAIRLAVTNGVQQHHWQFGDMPPVPAIGRDQITHLVAFIRGEQRQSGLIP